MLKCKKKNRAVQYDYVTEQEQDPFLFVPLLALTCTSLSEKPSLYTSARTDPLANLHSPKHQTEFSLF